VSLATQEAETRRVAVQSQPGQIAQETLSQKKKNKRKNFTQKGLVEQFSVGPEFKPQCHKQTNKQTKRLVISRNC
jgi:hypothetical protein